ncbi:MAG: hypothetical protein FWD40_07005 [Treponema sp.]|nr:hypothetical protein [Treponema sp.]
MRIKLCGILRDEDIDFVNETRPDYIGFIFTKGTQQLSTALAQYLRFRLAESIVPIGVFANAPIAMITELYHNRVISAAQLNGDEDDSYITQLKRQSVAKIRQTRGQPINVIKTLFPDAASKTSAWLKNIPACADYFLVDSAGSGKIINLKQPISFKLSKPWFLSGDINIKNIKQVMEINPFAVNISCGMETDGKNDWKMILKLITAVRTKN